MHFAIDGWTAPHVASYLGIVVIWYETGEIHRAILEFAKYVFPTHIYILSAYKYDSTTTG